MSSGGSEIGACSGMVISRVEVAASEPRGAVSTKHLITCAKEYLLAGRPLAEICEHNAAVASGLFRHQVKRLAYEVQDTVNYTCTILLINRLYSLTSCFSSIHLVVSYYFRIIISSPCSSRYIITYWKIFASRSGTV